MAINVNQDYGRFYAGSEQLKGYGENQAAGKDTLVKYEFQTTDADGSKRMDQMTKEETMKAVKEISAKYGDNVIVQFSGDGLAALAESKKFMTGKEATEEELAEKEAKNAAFSDALTPIYQRIVIPNAETNDQLYNSLAGADDGVINSAMGIISNYLMPADVSGLSEQERADMAAFGLEEAKYLAENYLDEAHAADFLAAMETIAKYGQSGVVSEDGTVAYHIAQGQTTLSGAPDSYVNMESWLKANDTDLYNQINELNQSIVNHKDGESYAAQFIELYTKAAKEILNDSSAEETKAQYEEWKESVEKTELSTAFSNISYTDFQSFFESLQNKSSLSNAWLGEQLGRLIGWLGAA